MRSCNDMQWIHFNPYPITCPAFCAVTPPPVLLPDEGPLIHGLDALVEHYRTSEDGLAVQLAEHYPGTAPPPDSLLHGSSNLLHRATEAGESSNIAALRYRGGWLPSALLRRVTEVGKPL